MIKIIYCLCVIIGYGSIGFSLINCEENEEEEISFMKHGVILIIIAFLLRGYVK